MGAGDGRLAARGLDTGGLGLSKNFVIIRLNTSTLSTIWIKEDEPMSTPILFVRERNQVGQGDKKPRFTVVGTVGTDLTINVNHILQDRWRNDNSSSGRKYSGWNNQGFNH
jgi:hypothetical protein